MQESNDSLNKEVESMQAYANLSLEMLETSQKVNTAFLENVTHLYADLAKIIQNISPGSAQAQYATVVTTIMLDEMASAKQRIHQEIVNKGLEILKSEGEKLNKI